MGKVEEENVLESRDGNFHLLKMNFFLKNFNKKFIRCNEDEAKFCKVIRAHVDLIKLDACF